MNIIHRVCAIVLIYGLITGPYPIVLASELNVTAEEEQIRLSWQAASGRFLQRSSTLEADSWEDVPGTFGAGTANEPRFRRGVYYRLAEAPEGSAKVQRMRIEQRIAELVANQIDRATGSVQPKDSAETPPDNGDVDARWGAFIFRDSGSYTWASQPGVIRTFTDSREMDLAFKLYSNQDSVASSWAELSQDVRDLKSWKDHPSRFVDLSEPVMDHSPDGIESVRYPIIDPRAATVDQVEGFSFDLSAVNAETHLPMPVEWVYQLDDGTIGFLDEAGRFQGEKEATAENPIVARFAYWTDDESTKINVNIASEGVPWDVPRAYTEEAKDYARYQPVTNEVQRYPGHPAMTSLSSVLLPNQYVDGKEEESISKDELKALYGITPRVTFGGTEDGHTQGRTPITFDRDPLYHSLDQLAETVSSKTDALVSKEQVERARGLLTTNSSAPEHTVHGRPRISMWPVGKSADMRSSSDERLAERTTLNEPYYYQRSSADDPFGEFYQSQARSNINLFQYLLGQVYQSIPGYGTRGSLARKSGSAKSSFNPSKFQTREVEYKLDHFQIALMMFDYIRSVNLVDGNVKYPYTRLTKQNKSFGQVEGLSLVDRDLVSGDGLSQHLEKAHDSGLEPKAPGRSYTLSEVAMVFNKSATIRLKSWNNGSPTFDLPMGANSRIEVMKRILSNEHPEYAKWLGRSFGPQDEGKQFGFVQLAVIPELFSVAQGNHIIHPNLSVQLLTGSRRFAGNGIRVNGIPLDLWGHDTETPSGAFGPVMATNDPIKNDIRGELPAGWAPFGGAGGIRLLRFGSFEIGDTDPGYFGEEFLASGKGPLRGLSCQTPIIVPEDELLTLEQDDALQLALYSKSGESVDQASFSQSFRIRFAQPDEKLTIGQPELAQSTSAGWSRRFAGSSNANALNNPVPLLAEEECIKGMIVSHGDYRHIAAKRNVPSELFRNHPLTGSRKFAHSLTWSVAGVNASEATFSNDLHGRSLVDGVKYDEDAKPDFTFDPTDREAFAPLLSKDYHFPIDPSITKDFDNGIGGEPDGAYINKADDGADNVPGSSRFNQKFPYFEHSIKTNQSYEDRNLEYFSPNRMVPSPVMFGSLPSAVQANAPWTCLLFRPNVATQPHLGEWGNGLAYTGDRQSIDGFSVPQFASVTGNTDLPPDHLWLDLFWMPAAEPLHISSPFTTHGKVNLNYQLFPFTYIHRATAMHAVLKGERLLAIPNSAGPSYKRSSWKNGWYHPIDASETLKQFEEKFERGELFLTESEICEQFLIPKDEDITWDGTGENIRKYWDKHRLSGDNTLERPYAGIYSRVTTRSNHYRVHVRIQSLEKSADTPADTFVPATDHVTGEYRGSILLERQFDPNNDSIPPYIFDLGHQEPRLETFYRTRVAGREAFAN